MDCPVPDRSRGTEGAFGMRRTRACQPHRTMIMALSTTTHSNHGNIPMWIGLPLLAVMALVVLVVKVRNR